MVYPCLSHSYPPQAKRSNWNRYDKPVREQMAPAGKHSSVFGHPIYRCWGGSVRIMPDKRQLATWTLAASSCISWKKSHTMSAIWNTIIIIISNPHGSASTVHYITHNNFWIRHLEKDVLKHFETFILGSPSESMALTFVLSPLRPAPQLAPATRPGVPPRGPAGAPSNACGAAVTGGFLAAWGQHTARTARRGRVVRLAETDPNSYVPILLPWT